jgi:hypothetical protein
MVLTTAQKVVLKTDILANGDTNTLYTDGNLSGLADLYNALSASVNNVVWKSNASITDIGNNFNATELAGLSSLNSTRLQTIALYSPNGINPSLTDRRAFFDDVFSGAGGATTRTQLLALWKRTANRLEKLFATGTGSSASPATLVVEGLLSFSDLIGL